MKQISDSREIEDAVFNIQSGEEFNQLALSVFAFQFQNNSVFRKYCKLLGRGPGSIMSVRDIPFLPIEFFKRFRVLSCNEPTDKVFISSGTTGSERSRHYIKKLDLYRKSFIKAFKRFYGNPEDYCILALLPGYLEQENSSLVFMVNELIKQTGHPDSGFYLHDHETLAKKLTQLDGGHRRVMLFGVSHALLNMAENYNFRLKNTLVIETGGMKGRRREITREELHRNLMKGFGVEQVHSEYGMAELLSQAYAEQNGRFHTPPWMRILIRDIYDPFNYPETRNSGGINIIDLANLYSCSFIETQDVGRKNEDGSFEVLGRFDYSDIRGCNLMVIE